MGRKKEGGWAEMVELGFFLGVLELTGGGLSVTGLGVDGSLVAGAALALPVSAAFLPSLPIMAAAFRI